MASDTPPARSVDALTQEEGDAWERERRFDHPLLTAMEDHAQALEAAANGIESAIGHIKATRPIPTRPTSGRVNRAKLTAAARLILEAIGEDPDREGLKGTPDRFARLWADFIEYDPGTLDTTFATTTIDQMVVVSGMRVWSLCEHHLLPFWADVSIAYITEERVGGLSKFGRIAQLHAHRLQLQERLVANIADHVAELTKAKSVAVIARGQHLCMTMRGVQMPHLMSSSDTRGLFRDDPRARAELFALLNAPPPATP